MRASCLRVQYGRVAGTASTVVAGNRPAGGVWRGGAGHTNGFADGKNSGTGRLPVSCCAGVLAEAGCTCMYPTAFGRGVKQIAAILAGMTGSARPARTAGRIGHHGHVGDAAAENDANKHSASDGVGAVEDGFAEPHRKSLGRPRQMFERR